MTTTFLNGLPWVDTIPSICWLMLGGAATALGLWLGTQARKHAEASTREVPPTNFGASFEKLKESMLTQPKAGKQYPAGTGKSEAIARSFGTAYINNIPRVVIDGQEAVPLDKARELARMAFDAGQSHEWTWLAWARENLSPKT